MNADQFRFLSRRGFTMVEAIIAVTATAVLLVAFLQGVRFFNAVYLDNNPLTQMLANEADSLSVMAAQDASDSIAAYAYNTQLQVGGALFKEATFTSASSPWLTPAAALTDLTSSYASGGKTLTQITGSGVQTFSSVLFLGQSNRVRAFWFITCYNGTKQGQSGLAIQVRRFIDVGGPFLVTGGGYDDFVPLASVAAADRGLTLPSAVSASDGTVVFTMPRAFNSSMKSALTGNTSLEGLNYIPQTVRVRPDWQPRSQ